MSQESEDKALLAWLLSGRDDVGSEAAVAGLRDPIRSVEIKNVTDRVDEGLREFGLNCKEREAFRRRRSHKTDWKSSERYRATIVKQFEFAIGKRVDWSTADAKPDQVAAAWAAAARYDQDRAAIDLLGSPNAEGIRVEDLALRVQGRTIAEHRRRGNSVEWCVQAARSERRRRDGLIMVHKPNPAYAYSANQIAM
ncbi:hypothetical protein [Amycolatopsis sp. GM8]|uniref:hypothetical protein n=1 Tax=Amycolatopsis sp. GM8 TaxID=2896530 RepID=UPI001F2B5ECD|nr:hypothetical protein [Amycolatopsis sp. GM8]